MFWKISKGHELAGTLILCLPEKADNKLSMAQKQFHYIKNSGTPSSDNIRWVLVKTDGEVRFAGQLYNMLIFGADRNAEISTLVDSLIKRLNSDGR